MKHTIASIALLLAMVANAGPLGYETQLYVDTRTEPTVELQ